MRHANSSLTPSSANRWRFSAKEIQTTAGVNLIDFGARLYDDRICRWTSQDPLAAKYPAFSPYAYCAGDPVNLVDPTGMEGVKYIDNNGQKTIESNIVVLVQAPSKISEHASDKQRRRIQNNNKDILANNSRRINSVINTLNRVYNGDAGGSYNSSGELVHFKFNVIPVETNDLENGNDQSLMQTALDNGLPSSQYGNDTISKAAIITTRSTEGNIGLFSGVSISVQPESFEFALPHEVGHSLGLGDTYWPDPNGKDQKPGGLMDNPPASPNASEVDKIWTKARNKRQ